MEALLQAMDLSGLVSSLILDSGLLQMCIIWGSNWGPGSIPEVSSTSKTKTLKDKWKLQEFLYSRIFS